MRNRAGDEPNLGTIQDFYSATISSSGCSSLLFFKKEYFYSGIQSCARWILQEQDLAPAGPCHPPAQSDAGTGRRTGKAQRGSAPSASGKQEDRETSKYVVSLENWQVF